MFWKILLPEKIKIFLWKAIQNIITLMDNLRARGIDVPPMCPICNTKTESFDYALVRSKCSPVLWQMLLPEAEVGNQFHGSFVDRWIALMDSLSPK